MGAGLVLALGIALAPQLTPAERAVESARSAISRDPQDADGFNQLAMALARQARETGNDGKYDEAEEALKQSFRLAPDNFEGLKVRTWLLLGKHEFGPALELAKRLNTRVPDDPMVYGFLADAHAELGNYREAEEAAQWMLDLGRGDIPGLTRAAYLRELFGDIEGAYELMSDAYDRLDPHESEDRAWTLTHLAHLRWLTGDLDAADGLLEEALRTFPGYHYALANRAKVRLDQGRPSEAVELLTERYQKAPHPENLYDLAVALERTGRNEQAQEAFAEFEKRARAEMSSWDNANSQLTFYYCDHAGDPAEALQVASREIERRRDVYTLDAYAWALHANGSEREARKHIEEALAVGIRDPNVLYHAGAIALDDGDPTAATKYLNLSLETNPRSEVAAEARRLLAVISGLR